MPKIHPSAVIETGAKIDKSVSIGAYCFISKDSQLCSGVEIMQGAQIHGKTFIDEETKIYPYAVIGMPPQDIGYKSEDDVSVKIGKRCQLREFVTVNAGTKQGGGTTSIGDECFIMIYCHIAHDCKVHNNVIMANNATLAGHVEIGDRVVIGGMTPIHQFVKIGEGCMIGGASAVSQDIPPFCLAQGNHALIKGLNLVGLKRRFEKETINALRDAYKKLFRTNRPLKEVANEILKDEKNKEVIKMCNFIINTKRGIPYERRQ